MLNRTGEAIDEFIKAYNSLDRRTKLNILRLDELSELLDEETVMKIGDIVDKTGLSPNGAVNRAVNELYEKVIGE